MDFTPKTYLIIYAVVVTPILLSFIFMRRGPAAPSRLRLGQEKLPPRSPSVEPQPLTDLPPTAKPAIASRTPMEVEPFRIEKSLNVLFQWNGHSWDAYEVLGLPAGSSRDAVHAAYTQLLKDGDVDSMPFFKAAYEVILKTAGASS